MLWCPNWTNQHYPGPRSSSRRKGPLSGLAVRQSCPHEPTGKLTGRGNNCCFFLFPLAGLSEETFLSVTIWLWQSVLKVPTISPSHCLLCWSSSLHSVADPVRCLSRSTGIVLCFNFGILVWQIIKRKLGNKNCRGQLCTMQSIK